MPDNQPTFRYWQATNAAMLIVATTPDSVTLTHRRNANKFDEAYHAGTLRQLVESDAKIKKDTVFYPTEVAHIPGDDKVWITSNGERRKFNSQVFNQGGASVADFISSEMMAGRPPNQRSLREFPKLRRPWVLFPLGMGLLVAVALAAVRIVASTYEAGDRRPIAAEAVLSLPLIVVVGLCVAALAAGAFQTQRRSASDQPILVYS